MLQLPAFVLVVKKEWRLCFQAQKHWLLQYPDHSPDIAISWNVRSILSLQKCLLIREFLQKWNNSSYCFSHKRDHCVSVTFPQQVSVGGHFNNKGSSRVQTDFHCYSPKIWGFFQGSPPAEQLCLNSRLALSYQSCGERRAEGSKELGEGREEDKRLKKSGHSIRSKWLQPAIWYHGDSGRLRKIESERLIRPPLLVLVSFYSDELVHLEKQISSGAKCGLYHVSGNMFRRC